ncbi:hypothetical protein NLG97_g3908 [Lecanicillium saksenae]|uniref:Uncharacterized protein n=1 Tax=Lecanicillium saksenae TaxID=468837 RepID=A0ACC1QXD1_9HYPO|nr:hypothetical protein NLG97_g3908 [Lecanicillium saksenae]
MLTSAVPGLHPSTGVAAQLGTMMRSDAEDNVTIDERRPLLSNEHDLRETPESIETHSTTDSWRAWLVVFGSWCASFCSFGWINSIGEFQRYYQSELLRDYTPAQVAWIPSLQIFCLLGMGPIIGILYDRLGPRPLLIVGGCLHVIGLMMLSISRTYFHILVWQGVCSAIGVSSIVQPALHVIPGWFRHRRGAAFGLLATGGSMGGIVFPIIIMQVREHVGFGCAIRICACLTAALMVIAAFAIKANGAAGSRYTNLKQFYVPLTEAKFVYLLVGLFLFTFGFYIPTNYIPSEAVSAGTPAQSVAYLIPLLSALSCLGRIFCGMLADIVGRYNVFIASCFLTGLSILALWTTANGTEARFAFSAIFGFCSAAYVTLLPALVHQISPPGEIGLRTGLVYLGCSIGGLTANPIGGVILERSGGWLVVKIFSGLLCLAGTFFVAATRLLQDPNVLCVV